MIIFKRMSKSEPFEKQTEDEEGIETADQAKAAVESFKDGEAYEQDEEFAVLAEDQIFTFRTEVKLDLC